MTRHNAHRRSLQTELRHLRPGWPMRVGARFGRSAPARTGTFATVQAHCSAAWLTTAPCKASAMMVSAHSTPQGTMGAQWLGSGPRHCANQVAMRASAWAASSGVTVGGAGRSGGCCGAALGGAAAVGNRGAGRWLCSHAGSNEAQSFSAMTCTTQPTDWPTVAAWWSSCWHCNALGKAGLRWPGAPVAKPAKAA